MPKKTFQDVIPPSGKSIRRVPINRERKRSLADEIPKVNIPLAPVRPVAIPFIEQRNKTEKNRSFRKKFIYYGLAFLAMVGGAAYLLAAVGGSASVKITPRVQNVTLSADFVAKDTPGQGELGYQIVTAEGNTTENVVATGQQTVKKKASGTIVLYNNYSSAPQRLIRNTRLETPDGLIFRTDASVVIPGQATVNGKTIPGSVEVLAYADYVGENYNLGLTDFTIPGFKGTPKFSTFYGRSKTAMQGGFNGVMKTISDADRSTAMKKIEVEAAGKLLKDADAKKPNGTTLVNGAYTIVFSPLADASEGDSVTVGEHGILTGYVFDEGALSLAIAKATLPNFDGNPVMISDFGPLSFTKKAPTKTAANSSDLSFTLKGQARIVSITDTEAVKKAISGKPRKDIEGILATFKSIDKAEVTVRPFWISSFPSDPAKIDVQ